MLEKYYKLLSTFHCKASSKLTEFAFKALIKNKYIHVPVLGYE